MMNDNSQPSQCRPVVGDYLPLAGGVLFARRHLSRCLYLFPTGDHGLLY